MGNLRSVSQAVQHAADQVGVEVFVTSDPDVVRGASRVVLPGQGAMPDCMRELRESGLQASVLEAAAVKPLFGVCVGMQMLADRGHEHAVTPGLGWIGGEIQAIAPEDASLKVPHMGWNDLTLRQAHPVLDGLATGDHAYFVHGWQFVPSDPATP